MVYDFSNSQKIRKVLCQEFIEYGQIQHWEVINLMLDFLESSETAKSVETLVWSIRDWKVRGSDYNCKTKNGQLVTYHICVSSCFESICRAVLGEFEVAGGGGAFSTATEVRSVQEHPVDVEDNQGLKQTRVGRRADRQCDIS